MSAACSIVKLFVQSYGKYLCVNRNGQQGAV